MHIDVSERIEAAKRLTREWAERSGYKVPDSDETPQFSKKARDLARILNASSFGCQQRNVHALLEALLDEKLPPLKQGILVDYQRTEPFAVGSMLVPVNMHDGSGIIRPGLVVRRSEKGNAGLRKSNGEMHNNHYRQTDLRPATDEEVDAYFAEFFGLSVNLADEPPPPEESEATVPEPFADAFDPSF